MDESFYLSNVLPQDLDNNAGFWNRMEIYCRDLTKKYKSVRVLSGPVMLSNFEEDGKRFIKHQVCFTKIRLIYPHRTVYVILLPPIYVVLYLPLGNQTLMSCCWRCVI